MTNAADFSAGVNANQRGDYATALLIFRQLADQGDANAQVMLGGMYAEGQGVAQDYAEALHWFRKAAEQGTAHAQNNLGVMYSKGWGVAQDYVQARLWFNLAAANGNDLGRKNRDSLAKKMTPAQIAEAQKLARVHPEDVGLTSDDDREWFCSLTETDIASLTLEDDVPRLAAFIKFKDEDLSGADASRRVWRYFPYFYLDPSKRGQNPLGLTGENAEMPFLIKDKINRLAIEGKITKDVAESAETMNAAIRQLLRRVSDRL